MNRYRLALHCHFEYPTDAACARFCGTIEPAELAARISARILHDATAWVLERAGLTTTTEDVTL